MAKVGKLTKLKSAIRRWPSFSKHTTRTNNNNSSYNNLSPSVTPTATSASRDETALRRVYVGRSKRRYLVSNDIINHPLFQELVDRSCCVQDEEDGLVVSCEVVLFEHLLWMLENGDNAQLGSMDELVEFYTC